MRSLWRHYQLIELSISLDRKTGNKKFNYSFAWICFVNLILIRLGEFCTFVHLACINFIDSFILFTGSFKFFKCHVESIDEQLVTFFGMDDVSQDISFLHILLRQSLRIIRHDKLLFACTKVARSMLVSIPSLLSYRRELWLIRVMFVKWRNLERTYIMIHINVISIILLLRACIYYCAYSILHNINSNSKLFSTLIYYLQLAKSFLRASIQCRCLFLHCRCHQNPEWQYFQSYISPVLKEYSFINYCHAVVNTKLSILFLNIAFSLSRINCSHLWD